MDQTPPEDTPEENEQDPKQFRDWLKDNTQILSTFVVLMSLLAGIQSLNKGIFSGDVNHYISFGIVLISTPILLIVIDEGTTNMKYIDFSKKWSYFVFLYGIGSLTFPVFLWVADIVTTLDSRINIFFYYGSIFTISMVTYIEYKPKTPLGDFLPYAIPSSIMFNLVKETTLDSDLYILEMVYSFLEYFNINNQNADVLWVAERLIVFLIIYSVLLVCIRKFEEEIQSKRPLFHDNILDSIR